MKKVLVFTGAGISKESGLQTFRDPDGLWKDYDFRELATPEAWRNNPERVLEFYNWRRKMNYNAEPNAAHLALSELEKAYDVQIVTQNVDNLHERAGSSKVLHLHGELSKARSSYNPDLVYEIGNQDIKMGQLSEDGSQLRPHIVWFGERVPAITPAIEMSKKADIFIVVGTSLQVYPAAELMEYVSNEAEKYVVDPEIPEYLGRRRNLFTIAEKAGTAIPRLVNQLLTNA